MNAAEATAALANASTPDHIAIEARAVLEAERVANLTAPGAELQAENDILRSHLEASVSLGNELRKQLVTAEAQLSSANALIAEMKNLGSEQL
jgi:hypothetical protein